MRPLHRRFETNNAKLLLKNQEPLMSGEKRVAASFDKLGLPKYFSSGMKPQMVEISLKPG